MLHVAVHPTLVQARVQEAVVGWASQPLGDVWLPHSLQGSPLRQQNQAGVRSGWGG